MKREIILNGRIIEYELEYKNVKNINLRVVDGRVYVSVNKLIGCEKAEEFLRLKADAVLKAIDKQVIKNPLKECFTEPELKRFILSFCENCYPYYEKCGVKKPVIKFRKMVSQWGNCNYVKGVLTFNKNLIYAPYECVEYVIWHEFTHFLVHDHSKRFYKELEKVCPNWKEQRKKLKEINIRQGEN